MLQWMGGSRRKVATGSLSRGSQLLRGRQKQYFEQRRRQQQNPGVEEGTATGSGSKRSLDIVSLLDLPSSVSHRHSAGATSSNDLLQPETPRKGDRSGGFLSGECGVRKDPPLSPADIEESRAPLGCRRMETVSAEKEFVTFPNGHASGLKHVDDKIDMQNSAPYTNNNAFCKAANRSVLDAAAHQSELSIFDLLVADGPTGDFEGKPAKEDHVAFSVEGLGKVGSETPVRSPDLHTRHANKAVSLKLKAAKRSNVPESLNAALGNFELELDEMMQDIDLPLSGSLSKFSRHNLCNELKENLSPPRDYKQYKGRSVRTGNPLLDDWDDADLHDGRKQLGSQKSWLSPICGDYTDFMDGNSEAAYAFHAPDRWENRNFQEATEKFNFREGARYRAAATTFDFRPDAFRPDCSGPLDKDERDAMSSLSEESCSTAEVRSKTNKMSRPSSTTGHGRIDLNTVHRLEVKSDPAIIWHDICEGNVYRPREYSRQPVTSKFRSTLEHNDACDGNVYRPGECLRQPVMSKFRSTLEHNETCDGNAYQPEECLRQPVMSKFWSTLEHNSPLQYKSREDSCWPFEEGYKSSHLELDTEGRKSERKPFSCYNPWTDSGIGECLISEPDLDAQFVSDNMKPVSTIVCPLSRTSEIENLVSGKPSRGNQTPSLSQHMFESPKAAFCSDFGSKGGLAMSSDGISEGDNLVLNQLSDLGRRKRNALELEETNYDCAKACKASMMSSQSRSCAEFCDAKDGSLETLASINVADESDSNLPTQEFDHCADAPNLDRKGNSVKSSEGAADSKMMMNRVNVSHIESSSTIMLGTCIFQLVCAQKVSKEALLRGS